MKIIIKIYHDRNVINARKKKERGERERERERERKEKPKNMCRRVDDDVENWCK